MINILKNLAIGDVEGGTAWKRRRSGSSGMVLITVTIFVMVAGVLAAGLYFAGNSRIKQIRQEVCFDKAFFTAEAGIERAKAALRNGGSQNGVLFGGTTNYGDGTFYVSTRTNMVGTNSFVIIRSTGTVETAMRALEVEVRLTTLSPMQSDGSVCFYGTNTSLYLKNANNHIDGHDYDVPTNFTGNGSACDGTLSTNPPAPGVYYASSTETNNITGSGDIAGEPPVTNGVGTYTEIYWFQFLETIEPYAMMYTSSSTMGTRDAPIITILPSGTTTKITGSCDGAGILIVPAGASLNVAGTFHYEGLLIVIGDGIVDTDVDLGGTFDFFGSTICLGAGLNLNATGRAALKYSTQALTNLSKLQVPARLDVIYWKEIKPTPN